MPMRVQFSPLRYMHTNIAAVREDNNKSIGTLVTDRRLPIDKLELRPPRLPEQVVRQTCFPRGPYNEVDGRAVRRRVHAAVDQVRADVGGQEVACSNGRLDG